MAMSLRIVVPPHPLIAHWLTVLRCATTPAPLYATGLDELGKWLSYEALRDWLPHRSEEVITNNGTVKGQVIENKIPLLAIPINQGGFELWYGARTVLPNANSCIEGLPNFIDRDAGLIVFIDQIASGKRLLETLLALKEKNVESKRIRVVTALASKPGLQKIGEEIADLTIYSGCIDPDLNENGEIIPGIGKPFLRLNTRSS